MTITFAAVLPYLIYAGVFLAGQWLQAKGATVPLVGPPAAPVTPVPVVSPATSAGATAGPFAALLHNVLSSNLNVGSSVITNLEQTALQTLLSLANPTTPTPTTLAK